MSSKGQVVIPKALRQSLGLRNGQRLSVSQRDGDIVLSPRGPEAPRANHEEIRRLATILRYRGPRVSDEEIEKRIGERLRREWRP